MPRDAVSQPPVASASPEETAARLLDDNRAEDAESLLSDRIRSGGGTIPVWRLLGRAIRAQGRLAEARTIQARLVDASPGDAIGRFDLAETLLLLGDYERGWREYRWRYHMPHTKAIERKVQRPRWDGKPMPGRTLLIHDEQGFGDTLQFMRLAKEAKARSGAHLVLEVTAPLLPLAQRMAGHDIVLPRGTLPPPFHAYCELMSLPLVLGLRLDDLPGPIPYLTPDPLRRAVWQQRLSGLPRPLVALVWAGRPTHTNDANRSMSLADFSPLAQSAGTFLAIQKGPAAAEALSPPSGMPILSLDDEIKDFEDTAAILMVADVLVSVDSAPVHLAGALGRPAFVLLPMVPDWRWLMDREDTPWYPSVRLFRQRVRRDWRAPLSGIRAALEAGSYASGTGP
ncbi:glycosyl transferase family 8 [Aquabacter spiritensis]|uniref:Glycosyl transferase family 9 (Putative heptosyltransferase) n=1 Tax=Aquabacter spiritensis TaxID=933073 RepID=A0A4V2UYJ3_9HYPH|nr:glycosyl transferase family 8 [Aquabacter spiritensis]TCT07708.1 glycosyl transferase family 9 (putative heptosyltransferase) [Aquabacter spiritensis]